MRAVRFLLLVQVVFMGSPVEAAPDCPADRAAAHGRIGDATRALEQELDPYELAVRAGNLGEFERRADPVIRLWEGLLATIRREQQRVAALPCPVEGIPNEYRLPPDWDMVRDIGARQIVDLDRGITDLNARVRQGGPPRQGVEQ